MSESMHDWSKVRGIDLDGSRTLDTLRDLISKDLSADERWGILTNLAREGVVSSAAYPAIPLLLSGHPGSARVSWEMAVMAALVLSSARASNGEDSPEHLGHFTNEANAERAMSRLLSSAAEADLEIPDMLETFASIMELQERVDIALLLRHLALDRNKSPGMEPTSFRSFSFNCNLPILSPGN